MKCISIQQPWAWAIFHAGKDVENRTWALPRSLQLPARVLIHAGKKIDMDGMGWLYIKGIDVPDNLPTGCILGEVTIWGSAAIHYDAAIDRHYAADMPDDKLSKWAFVPYIWHLRNPVSLETPIPYKGQLGFFEVSLP